MRAMMTMGNFVTITLNKSLAVLCLYRSNAALSIIDGECFTVSSIFIPCHFEFRVCNV